MARIVENKEYFEFAKRIINAGAKRAGNADEHDLKAFSDLKKLVDEQLNVAVSQQRQGGKSWADIGYALGISRQSAFKRFSRAA
jgi:hypothetical protein